MFLNLTPTTKIGPKIASKGQKKKPQRHEIHGMKFILFGHFGMNMVCNYPKKYEFLNFR